MNVQTELRDFVIHFELVEMAAVALAVFITALVTRPSFRYYYCRHFLPAKMKKKSCDLMRGLGAFQPYRKESLQPRYLKTHCAFRRASLAMTTTRLPLDQFTKRAVILLPGLHTSYPPPSRKAAADTVIIVVVKMTGRLHQSPQSQEK